MGRLSRAFKKISRVALPVLAPMIPVIGPLIAVSAARAQPRVAPEEVADPAPGGGFLPRVRTFVQEEIAPILAGTPYAIVDREGPGDEEEYYDDDGDDDEEDYDDEDEGEDE